MPIQGEGSSVSSAQASGSTASHPPSVDRTTSAAGRCSAALGWIAASAWVRVGHQP